MNELTDILAHSAVDCAQAEMHLAIYLMRQSGLYEQADSLFDEGEWGMLTSTAALGYMYEFILKRLSEEQKRNSFEPCFDKATVQYFAKTGASNASHLAYVCMKSLDRQENKTFFDIGRISCNEQEGLYKNFRSSFSLKFNLN
jgi:hypothetical protein